MPGMHLPIRDPARRCSSDRPDYVLLLAWNYKDEVDRASRPSTSPRGGRFIVPVPSPQIV